MYYAMAAMYLYGASHREVTILLMAQRLFLSSPPCAASYAGHALWCAPLPSVPLLEPEQAPDSSPDSNDLLTAALEGPLLPNDQQKVSLEGATAVCASSACHRQPSSH